MLRWVSRFNIFSFLDNQQYQVEPNSYECLLAAGVQDSFSSDSLAGFDDFLGSGHGWVFGHLGYELKNSIHFPGPVKKDRIGFPEVFFFRPLVLMQLGQHELKIHAEDPNKVFREVMEQPVITGNQSALHIKPVLTRQQYIDIIEDLQRHILRGDCYEINFCQEFFAESAIIDPVAVYDELVRLSPNPFSGLYRINDSYLICASPERYLTRKGSMLCSQPMKGTIGRAHGDAEADNALREALRFSSKDRSENVMVVDMVRNDLTRICKKASVKVNELYGVYTYPNVHQMISTVCGELKDDIRFSEIIQATFPMGSMTGAPKHRVMELIDQYEQGRRGIYSGSIGYLDPEGNFDFNVVIRSIMYNEAEKYLSFQLGSGITYYSEAEKEWEECLLKGEAIKKVLTGVSTF